MIEDAFHHVHDLAIFEERMQDVVMEAFTIVNLVQDDCSQSRNSDH